MDCVEVCAGLACPGPRASSCALMSRLLRLGVGCQQARLGQGPCLLKLLFPSMKGLEVLWRLGSQNVGKTPKTLSTNLYPQFLFDFVLMLISFKTY